MSAFWSLNKDAPIYRAIQYVGDMVSVPVSAAFITTIAESSFRYTQRFSPLGPRGMRRLCVIIRQKLIKLSNIGRNLLDDLRGDVDLARPFVFENVEFAR